MDLGFCFQDLGDGGEDSFIKSFIEPSGHAYQDAMLEDLVSPGGSHLGLSEDSGWDASSFLHPSTTTPYGTTATAHHNHHHHHNHYSHATSSSFAASSPSPASSSPSGRSSPAGSSLMTLADYDEGGLLVDGGVHAGAAMGFPPLGLSYFDLQAMGPMGPMDMPMDALGLYGLGGTGSSSFNALVDPLMSAPPPPAAAHRGGGGGARHVLHPVKQEHGHHFPYHHHHHHQPQHQHQQQQQGALPASAPSKAGAGVPGMWSPDEPVQRKRKLAASRRPTLAASAAASETIGEASTGREQQKGGGGGGKAGDLYELPLAVELAGALVGHRGVAVKLEERPEAATNAKHHQQQKQQQQKQQQQGEPVELVVERQPPVEVRTRTPSENRNFGVTVRITGHHDTPLPIQSVEVRLAYASSPEDVNQQILGGKKTVSLKEDGRATFDNLSMREASTKHGEREFCLEFVPLTKDGQPLGSFGTRTSAFYAYSHMKVLARRKSVKLRTLNKSHGSVHGGDKMHVIGQPFIKGPSLSIIFATPHGDVTALNPEMYSDSVLFFEAPPYPCPAIFSPYNRDPVREVKVMVQVTNDGRTMSNPLEFTYIADKPVHRADF